MKLPNFPAKSAILFVLMLGSLPIARASGDVNGDLEALRKKIAAKEAEKPRQSMGGRQLSLQIKQLQALIARADYERAQQMLGNLAEYGLDPELQEEWAQVFELLGKELQKLQVASMEKWRGEVDQLVADAKKGCMEATSSADLDSLLVRCAALQMRREQQNNVLGERTTRKLMGAASTLSAWANYLDCRDSGNIKRANEALRGLRTNDSNYPVLSVKEIECRFITDDAESLNVRSALGKVFEGMKSPEDLPAALERLKTLSANPMNPELGNLRSEQNRILLIQQAWEAAKKGDDETASRSLERMASSGGFDDAQAYYEPLKRQVLGLVLQRKAEKWTKLPRNEDEGTPAYLGRILDELQGKEDYATMIEVMRFSDQISRPGQTGNFASDRGSMERFLAAQRFENSGDVPAAVTNYRFVVGSPPGKYVPLARSQEALKNLQEKFPEAFKSNEGALMEEMRGLRQQMQMLLGRTQGGRPFPP